VEKVIGFDTSTIAKPPKGEISAQLFHPLLNRGGEKYTTIPEWLPIDDPYNGVPPMADVKTGKTGAERAVNMVLDRIAGRPWESEVIVDGAFPTVKVASGIKDITKARIAFVCGGGLVKIGEEPFTHSGAVDGRWAKYNLAGMNALSPEEWEVHHSGYTPDWIKEDPHRLHPLPEIRQLEKEGKCKVSPILYSWSSLFSKMVGCRKVAEGILPFLKEDQIDAVITDAT
jgi:glycine reductase